MKFLNCSVILAFISFIIGCLAAEIDVDMKILVISTTKPASIIKTLQSYSIEYDYLEYNYENPLKGDLPLYTEDEKPKYYGVVLGNGALSVYFEKEDRWGSILTDEQWDYLKDYQKKFGVRVVALDDNPEWEYGTSIADSNVWGTDSVQKMKVSDNEYAKSLFENAGIKTSIELESKSLYHVPVKIVNSKTTIPIMTFEPNDDFKKESVSVAYNKDSEGRERLSFYLAFGDWSINSVMLNHLWVSWVTRSLYAGERRVTFTPHIDDVFISTGRINFVTKELEGTNSYRTTVQDFENLKKWQDDILKELPEGSLIRCELAFNGNGIIAAASPSSALQVDGERYCDIEYVKVPGKGVNRWPMSNWTIPYDNDFLRKDELFKYFEKEENQKNFFWSSHTFTHENLDEATTSDADNEIRNNIELAKRLGIYDKEWWSGKSIITPQISGLRNVDAINIFKKYGIESGTGDLSRPTLGNKENPYLPFITTKESSNYEGFPIIPRSPTEVYYSSSNTEENTFIYNLMYEEELGESTWDEILERETNRAITLMLNLRNEAHQFHQINIRSYDNKEDGYKSILELWSTAVLKKYASMVNWPVTSLKLDDQAKLYIERYNRIKLCDVSKALVLDGDYVTAVKVTPNSIKEDCKIPVTIPKKISKSKDDKISTEKIGNDNMVVWFSFEKGDSESKTVKLNPPLPWANDAKEVDEIPDEEEKEKETEKECWSEVLGYKCCKENESYVEYIDDDGWWGVSKESGKAEWCGIIKNEECWALDFGLPCCESEDKLDYIMDNEVIGYEEKYENDESRPAGGWCGIKSAVDNVNKNALKIFKEQLGL